MSENKTNVTQQQQMVRGAAWLTASNFISRLLGAFYIIPWYAWMGLMLNKPMRFLEWATIFMRYSYLFQQQGFPWQ